MTRAHFVVLRDRGRVVVWVDEKLVPEKHVRRIVSLDGTDSGILNPTEYLTFYVVSADSPTFFYDDQESSPHADQRNVPSFEKIITSFFIIIWPLSFEKKENYNKKKKKK